MVLWSILLAATFGFGDANLSEYTKRGKCVIGDLHVSGYTSGHLKNGDTDLLRWILRSKGYIFAPPSNPSDFNILFSIMPMPMPRPDGEGKIQIHALISADPKYFREQPWSLSHDKLDGIITLVDKNSFPTARMKAIDAARDWLSCSQLLEKVKKDLDKVRIAVPPSDPPWSSSLSSS